MPVEAHIKEHPAWFHRFEAVWTPTVLLFDSDGKERVRLEGYLTKADFNAALMSGLGRIAFVHKRFADAERWYDEVLTRYAGSHYAPAAMYWRAVSRYSASHDHTILGKVAGDLKTTYPSSMWATKAIPWLPSPSPPS